MPIPESLNCQMLDAKINIPGIYQGFGTVEYLKAKNYVFLHHLPHYLYKEEAILVSSKDFRRHIPLENIEAWRTIER